MKEKLLERKKFFEFYHSHCPEICDIQLQEIEKELKKIEKRI